MIIPDEMTERGAVQLAIESYPRVYVQYGVTPRQGVFAVRYFDEHDAEVGYRLPSVTNEYHYFRPHRLWWNEYLRKLEWVIEVRPHD